MVKAARTVGRPPSDSPRYPNGRPKPQGDPRALNLWHRIKALAVAGAADPRAGTQLGLLSLTGDLTDTQVETGFLIARVYGEYERHRRRRRTTASPSYMRSFGDPDGQDPVDPIEIAKLEKRILSATARWQRLQDAIEELPIDHGRALAIIEWLCVEDRPVSADMFVTVRFILDRVAEKFSRSLPPAGASTAPSIAVTARRPPRRPRPGSAEAVRPRRDPLNKTAWLQVQRILRPDLDDAGLEQAWATFEALIARAHFRRQKARG